MAPRKMTRTETTDKKVVENVKEEEKATPVTVDADELIKSILNNVGSNNTQSNTYSKRYILCRSVTNGMLNVNCRSGNVYEFRGYGSDCEIEYDDLVALVRKRSDHIFNPRFVIEDEEFISEFPQIANTYENIYSINELNSIFNLQVNAMMDAIKSMPANIQKNLQSMIATKIADGSIDSVKKIRALSNFYNSDFNLLSELFSK